METNRDNQNDAPILCVKQCGFFGNPVFQNMCSKCFKEHQKESSNDGNQVEKQSNDVASNLESTASASVIPSPSSSSSSSSPPPATEPSATVPVVEEQAEVKNEESVTAPVEEEEKSPELPKQVRKDRCYECKTKLTLAKQISNQCRCGFIYCDNHRHTHACTFDHQQRAQAVLAEQNPKIAFKSGGRSFTRLD